MLDRSQLVTKVQFLKDTYDVPYTKSEIDTANAWADHQSEHIVKQIYSEAADVKEAFEKRKKEEGSKVGTS
ncbi:hypothetical protein [Halpernia sp. GG3]